MEGAARDHALDVLEEVWDRRKWLALATFLLAATAGVTAALSLPDIYRSTTSVIVEQDRSDIGGVLELEGRLQLISQEILSRSGLEPLIARLNPYPHLQGASMEALVQRMRSDIRTEFKLQPQPSGIGATFAFNISYRGTGPEIAARVANALAAAYIDEDLKIRERQAGEAVKVLKTQLDDVKRNLEAQERRLAEFQDQHLGELPQQSEANMASLERSHAELRTTSEERIRALDRRNELLRQMTEVEAAGGAVSSGGPVPVATRLARRKEELAELSQRYSDKYPDVVRLKEEVASLEREAAEAGAGAAAGGASASGRSAARLRDSLREVETDIKTLKSEETRLRGEISDRIRRLESVPQRQRLYSAIARDQQTTRDLYDSLRKRYEQAQLEQGDGGRPGPSPFRILDPAVVPSGPAAPNRIVLLLAALVGALAVAAAAVALAEWLDTSFHSATDLRSFTRVPVAASIPLIVTATDLRTKRRRVGLAAVSFLLGMGIVIQTVHHVARSSEGFVLMLARSRP